MSNKKDLLVTTIKEWVDCEKKIKEYNAQVKEFKDKKKILTKTLVEVMKNNEIDCFDINDGKIVHKTSKTKSSISKPYLLEILGKCFENNPEINCEEIGNLILENRPIKENHSIVMKKK